MSCEIVENTGCLLVLRIEGKLSNLEKLQKAVAKLMKNYPHGQEVKAGRPR